MNEINSRKIFLTTILFGLLLLFYLGCIQQKEEEFAFEWDKNGILYKSNAGQPKTLLREFSLQQKIILKSEVYLEKSESNLKTFNQSIIPFYAVLAGNDKNAIQLIFFIKDNERKKCSSNFGDVKTQVEMDKNQCIQLLNKWKNTPSVFFPLPNSPVSKSFIEVKENEVIVRAKSVHDQSVLSSALAEELFPNAKSVLEKAKKMLEKMK